MKTCHNDTILILIDFNSLAISKKMGKMVFDKLINTSERGEYRVNIKPLGDRILVKRIEEEEVRKGGIIIPDTAKEKPQQGSIVAVGSGKVNEDGNRMPLEVKAGDRVLFGKYAGSEVKIGDEEYLIMREDDILGIIEG